MNGLVVPDLAYCQQVHELKVAVRTAQSELKRKLIDTWFVNGVAEPCTPYNQISGRIGLFVDIAREVKEQIPALGDWKEYGGDFAAFEHGLFERMVDRLSGRLSKLSSPLLAELTGIEWKKWTNQYPELSRATENGFYGEDGPKFLELFQDPLDGKNFALDFLGKFGISHTVCTISLWGSLSTGDRELAGSKMVVHLKSNPILAPLYIDLAQQLGFNAERIEYLCQAIEEAYNESVQSIDKNVFKSDYRLLLLPNYQEMAHLRDGPELDFTRPLPRYWFDPIDFDADEYTREQLRERLALNRDALCYSHIIYCGFPAGSAFLCCKAESQYDHHGSRLTGGNTEYLYLRNPITPIHITQVKTL